MKTNQEAFTKIVTHLRKQGEKSIVLDYNGAKMCVYLSDEGLKCAIGCLINSAQYSTLLEETNIGSYGLQKALRNSGWGDIDKDFLRSMQGVHDAYLPKYWEDEFAVIAERYSLELPALETIL